LKISSFMENDNLSMIRMFQVSTINIF